jgi:hypothetical protein
MSSLVGCQHARACLQARDLAQTILSVGILMLGQLWRGDPTSTWLYMHICSLSLPFYHSSSAHSGLLACCCQCWHPKLAFNWQLDTGCTLYAAVQCISSATHPQSPAAGASFRHPYSIKGIIKTVPAHCLHPPLCLPCSMMGTALTYSLTHSSCTAPTASRSSSTAVSRVS